MAGYGEISILSSAAFLAIYPDPDLGNASMIASDRVSHGVDTSDKGVYVNFFAYFRG
ncbi:MAG TPA: hypothetical protein VMW06_03270 [Desulfobacterales bacterium]|nr:hypothetical protein [Desulfobacterales bacterium]